MDVTNARRLRHILTEYFNESELQNLVFDLGDIDYENLSGKTKADKVRELITSLDHRGRLSELLQLCYSLRPNAPWGEKIGGEDLPTSKTPPPAPVQEKSHYSGGVHFGGSGTVHIKGDVVGGNQKKTVHESPSSKPEAGADDIDRK